jgi:hypothetical protein
MQDATIIGNTNPLETPMEYTWETTTQGVNGDYYAEWSLEGDVTSVVKIKSQTNTKCTLEVLNVVTEIVQGTITLKLRKQYDNSIIVTTTKTLAAIMEGVVITSVTNPIIQEALYSRGFVANAEYSLKEEVELISAEQLENIFDSLSYSDKKKVTQFNEFQYFTGVTEIPAGMFAWRNNFESLVSITIPNSVKTIGNTAFYQSHIKNIDIPYGVTTIGNLAISYGKFENINIPDSVTNVGDQAFAANGDLKYIKIGSGVTTIGARAFNSSSGELTINCNIPSTTSGTSSTFYGARFSSILIGEGVQSIGKYAFNGCANLASITIPDSVTSIGDYAFYNCPSLTEFKSKFASEDGRCIIIDGVLSFFAQGGLNEYDIPNGVISIGLGFRYSKIASLTIPDSVTTIKNNAFDNCHSLTSVTIPDSVTTIGTGAFQFCRSLKSITIPGSVTIIEEDTFNGCSSLTSVNIGDGVTTIKTWAFDSCTSLTSVTIPDSVTTIEREAFEYCTSLNSITLPNSITFIGDFVFNSCTSLTSVNIPDSVTTIGGSAFRDCTRLPSVIIPYNVISIGSRAFQGCISLKSIICRAKSAPKCPSDVFGSLSDGYTGRNTYNTGENMLYVPVDATGYEASYWLDPLQNAEKCGFTISYSL